MTNEEFFILGNKLDKIIEALAVTNALLYRALGGTEQTSNEVKCPECDNHIEPNSLGYCPICKADLKSLGVIKEEKE